MKLTPRTLFMLLFLLTIAAPARAARLDVNSLVGLTAGSTPVPGVRDVWFDGSIYTYAYATFNNPDLDYSVLRHVEGLLRAQGLTDEEIFEQMEFISAGETEAAYFLIDAELPSDITWGLGDPDDDGWRLVRPLGETEGGNLSCFADTPTGDSLLCENLEHLAQSHWPEIDLVDGRLEGSLPNDSNGTPNYLYIQSAYGPTLAEAIIRQRITLSGLELQHWYFQSSDWNVYVPGIAPVPEPGTLFLLGGGVAILRCRRRQRRV